MQTPEGLNSKNLQHGVVSNFSDLFNNKGSSFGMVDTSAHGDIPSMTFTQNSNMGVQQGINGGMNTSKPGYSSYSPHMFGAHGNVVNASATSFTNAESSSHHGIEAVLGHPTSIFPRKFSFPNVSDLFPMGFGMYILSLVFIWVNVCILIYKMFFYINKA